LQLWLRVYKIFDQLRVAIGARLSLLPGHEGCFCVFVIYSLGQNRSKTNLSITSLDDHEQFVAMTRKHKKQAPYTDASVTLDPALSLGSIRKPGGLDEAKSCISRHTSRSSPAEYERIIRGLSASPDVLALLLVCESFDLMCLFINVCALPACSELLQMTTARLLEDSPFPGSTESYRSSCQGTMLIAFHKFWSSIQPPGDVDTVEFQLRTKAIFAAHILISKELDSAFEFERPSPSSSHSQKKRKQLQKHVTATSVSFVAQNAFECLGEEQPHTLDEKHELVKRLLDRQEATLKVCAGMLHIGS